MRAILTALLLTVASQAGAENQQVGFGGETLNLPKPDGLCEVAKYGPNSKSFEFHKALQRKANNKLLALYEECLYLDRVKIGIIESGPPEWLMVTAFDPNPDEEKLFKNISTQSFIEETVKMVSNIATNDLQKMHEFVEKETNEVLENLSVDGKISVSEPLDLGILDIGDAVYHGFIMDVKGGNESFLLGAVFSYLLVNGVVLNIYKYKNYKDKQTVKELLSESRYYITRLVHSN